MGGAHDSRGLRCGARVSRGFQSSTTHARKWFNAGWLLEGSGLHLVSSVGNVRQPPCALPSRPEGHSLEFHVRSARLTDVEPAIRVLARTAGDSHGGRDEADLLRSMLYQPAATVVVAESEHRIVGVGVLSIRPSVRSGPFIGCVDDLGLVAGLDAARDDAPDTSLRSTIGASIIEHLVVSARNKGCTRVEVTDPLASAEAPLLNAAGFAGPGTHLSRTIG